MVVWLLTRLVRWTKDPFSYENAFKALAILYRRYRKEDWYAGIRVEEFHVRCWQVSVGICEGHHSEFRKINSKIPWIGPVPVSVHKAWNG